MSTTVRAGHRAAGGGPWDRRDLLAVLALAALPWVLFWPLVAPGQARHYFPSGDFVDQFYAFAVHETRELAAGRVPLWNPYAYAGSPFWADVQSAVPYPPRLAVVLTAAAAFGRLPFLALELEALAHLALAGTLTYVLARRLIGSRLGALTAAVTFAAGGYLTGYPPLQLAVLETVAWLPLVLLGVEMIVGRPSPPMRGVETAPGRPGSSRPGVVVLAVALGMTVLAGHPQTALHVLSVAAAYAAWRGWRRGKAAPLAAAAALGAALSAAGWLPALEMQRLSNRAAVDYLTVAHGFPPRELLGLILPRITHFSPLYAGVLPLLLAVGAAARGWRSERPGGSLRVFWSVVAVVALLLSLGGAGPFFDALYLAVPGFDLFRGQERAAGPLAFALAMLAGHGLADWVRAPRATRPVLSLGSAAVGLAGVAFAVVAPPDARSGGLWAALVAGAAAALGWAATMPARRAAARSSRAGWRASAAILLVVVDLAWVSGGTNLQAGAPGELEVTPVIAMLKVAGLQRIENEGRLPPNFGVLHRLESTYGASPLRIRHFDLLHRSLGEERPDVLRALLAVSHVVSWRSAIDAPASPLIVSGSGAEAVTVHELAAAQPAAWRPVGAERVDDDADALARVAAPGFDPFGVALLHGVEPGPVAPGDVAGPHRRPGSSRVETTGDGPGWIVFSEMFYPGWRATVDDRPAPVVRADVALVAVPVPAGRHAVEIRFTSPSATVGLAASIAAALALAVLAALSLAPRDGRGAHPILGR